MSKGNILIADDEESIRLVLTEALTEAGFEVAGAETGLLALTALQSRTFDLAFVDIIMPDLSGLDLLSRVKEEGLETLVVIMTAQTTMPNAIEAMKRGAYDYLTKPFHLEEVKALAQKAMAMRRLTQDLHRLRGELTRRYELIVGKSPAMQEVYKIIGRVANSDATVLIQGESGTGKELIAKVIHYHSSRWRAPFLAINCSAIPRDLLESELFGHERGAFTGALERRPGKFELATGGTLFLDEVADMPLDLQAKLLRVLQEREFTRIGGRETIKADVRIIAATNQNLEEAVKDHRFREDLYYRLKVVPIIVPPLRQRRSDIPELINYFIDKMNREMGTQVAGVSPDAREMLARYAWPGNVRELENALLRAALLAKGRTLMPEDFSLPGTETPVTVRYDNLSLEEAVRYKLREYFHRTRDAEPTDLYSLIMAQAEKPLIELTLARTGGNQLKAAEMLGINRNTLRKKIAALGIQVKK